jgi:hypothetical protein
MSHTLEEVTLDSAFQTARVESVLHEMIAPFVGWLDRNGFNSYDQYDLWSTRFGKLAKRLYYRHNRLGSPLVAPIFLADILVPAIRGAFVPKRRFPIADAHFIMAFVNLFELLGDAGWLRRAERMADELLVAAIPGYSGYCWGYPFDWETSNGLLDTGTPLITTTPYCFEAYLNLFDATRNDRYLAIAQSAAEFAARDIRDTRVSADAFAASYTPGDDTRVTNASAYRAFMLAEAYGRFDRADYKEKATANINFILQTQRPDGSWLYAVDTAHNAFIDNFHTCFVLKNLYKANKHLRRADVSSAIEKGYRFYRTELFNASGVPKPFAAVGRLQVVQIEGYDYAEGIALGALLDGTIHGALTHATELAARVRKTFQLEDGHFVTRLNVGGISHTVPYLRWPQAQMFCALTSLGRALARKSSCAA